MKPSAGKQSARKRSSRNQYGTNLHSRDQPASEQPASGPPPRDQPERDQKPPARASLAETEAHHIVKSKIDDIDVEWFSQQCAIDLAQCEDEGTVLEGDQLQTITGGIYCTDVTLDVRDLKGIKKG